jgi:hypothetical protein
MIRLRRKLPVNLYPIYPVRMTGVKSYANARSQEPLVATMHRWLAIVKAIEADKLAK